MSTTIVQFSFENISLPLVVDEVGLTTFIKGLNRFLLTSFINHIFYSSFLVLITLEESTSLFPCKFQLIPSARVSKIEVTEEMITFIVNSFVEQVKLPFRNSHYSFTFAFSGEDVSFKMLCAFSDNNNPTLSRSRSTLLSRGPSPVPSLSDLNKDDDTVSLPPDSLNTTSSSGGSYVSPDSNRSYTITLKKDTSFSTLLDSVINNAKDYLPMSTIKTALSSSLEKLSGVSLPSASPSTSRVPKSVDDLGKDKIRGLLSNQSLSDLLSLFSKPCKNECNLTCPKCDLVSVVRNITPSSSIEGIPENVSASTKKPSIKSIDYEHDEEFYTSSLVAQYKGMMYDISMDLLGDEAKHYFKGFIDVMIASGSRRSSTSTLETSSYVKRRYKRDVPIDFDLLKKEPVTMSRNVVISSPEFNDSIDKVVIDPGTIDNVILDPLQTPGQISIPNKELIHKIYTSTDGLIMDFTNITLEIIKDGVAHRFVTTNGSYSDAESFLKYIVDAYGVTNTMRLVMDKFVGMEEADFLMLLELILKNTNLVKRLLHNEHFRENITPIFLNNFFTIDKQSLKPILSKMVKLFNDYDDKGFFVNNFIPLQVYYEYSSKKSLLKQK